MGCTKRHPIFVYISMTLHSHISPEPSEGLLLKILSRIALERRCLSIKHRLALFSFSLIVSVVAFMPAFKLTQTNLQESGFSQFLSMLVSDSATILIYWKN